MPVTQDRIVKWWIVVFGTLAVILVVYGGYVRLTRSGLSIVEWNPVSGTLPPLSQKAWQAEFVKYQETPEYKQVNRGMTLDGYREIFLVEWTHRVIARFAGLVFALPLLVFLVSRRIPWRESPIYLGIGLLFLAQAVMGWLMVASGLADRPSVSHFLLAAHLFLALGLIGISTWVALGHHYGFAVNAQARWTSPSAAALAAFIVMLLQLAYGAFTAGLKAGLVSNTWPRMLGKWIPTGLFRQMEPASLSIVAAPLTVAFIHRWLGVLALLLAVAAYVIIQEGRPPREVKRALQVALMLGIAQVGVGIAVVVTGVSMTIALLHQLNAILLFVAAVFVLQRLRARDTTLDRRRASN